MKDIDEAVAVILGLGVLTVGLTAGTIWAMIESGMLP